MKWAGPTPTHVAVKNQEEYLAFTAPPDPPPRTKGPSPMSELPAHSSRAKKEVPITLAV